MSADLEEACGRRTIQRQQHRLLGQGPCELPQVALHLECCRHSLAVVPHHRREGICRQRR